MLFAKNLKQYFMQGNSNICLSATDNRSYSLCGNHLYLSIFRYIVLFMVVSVETTIFLID